MDIYKKFKIYKSNRKILEVKNIDSKVVKSNYCIIIPYRNDKLNERKLQLNNFIEFSKKFFDSNIKIYIIEQEDGKKFNRGKLLNIGIKLAKNIEYYIFHDVDLIPDKSLLEYYNTYPSKPIHIARLWKDKYTYYTFFGGITSISKTMILKANGFPNNFWGWGGEDDALYNRISNLTDEIYAPNKGKITEMKHTNAVFDKKDNIEKKKLLIQDSKIWKDNGLQNLKFKILSEKNISKNIFLVKVSI